MTNKHMSRRHDKEKNPHAVEMGRLGGMAKSLRKRIANRRKAIEQWREVREKASVISVKEARVHSEPLLSDLDNPWESDW